MSFTIKNWETAKSTKMLHKGHTVPLIKRFIPFFKTATLKFIRYTSFGSGRNRLGVFVQGSGLHF